MTQLSTPEVGRAYALGNEHPYAGETLDTLAQILDRQTVAILDEAVDWSVPGRRCLELGAGTGSIAAWMQQAGDGAEVVAVDVDPRHVRVPPSVRVLAVDVAGDGLPAGPWDVVHARLLLAHLPQRRDILLRCAAALAPGGVLLVEEWGAEGTGRVLSEPGGLTAAVYQRYTRTLLQVFTTAGNDTGWCTQVPAAMTEAGLTDITVHTQARSWTGGTAGTRLPVLVSTQLQEQLVAAGMPAGDLDRLRTALARPELLLLGNLTFCTLGRKPHQPGTGS